MAFYQFPGTNFNDLNLDWLLQQMKNCLAEWASTKTDWQALTADNAAFKERIEAEWDELQQFVTNYFNNLDVSEEISDKINAMAADGSLLALIDDTVIQAAGSVVSTWITANLSQETGYVIDTSLTVSNAAADAAATGDAVKRIQNTVSKRDNGSVVNLWNPADETNVLGAYTQTGLHTDGLNALYVTNHLSVSPGDVIYLSWTDTSLTICFYDESKTFVSSISLTGSKFSVPSTDTIRYMTVPVNRCVNAIAVITKSPIIPGFNQVVSGTNQETDIRLSTFSRSSAPAVLSFIKSTDQANFWSLPHVKYTTTTTGGFSSWYSGATEAVMCGRGNIIIATNGTVNILLYPPTGDLYRAQNESGAVLSPIGNIGEDDPPTTNNANAYYLKANGQSVIVKTIRTGKTRKINILDYIDATYWAEIGICIAQNQTTSQRCMILYAAGTPYYYIDSAWRGKTWYAYGTSITSAARGTYVPVLASMAGMTAVNKGIAGEGIGNLGAISHGAVYSAICNVTDGKLDADLITLETAANDVADDTPLGTIFDTGTSTLSGCLNDCIRYLQANTDAQIAIIASPAITAAPETRQKYYTWKQMIQQICQINKVKFILPDSNMGYAKLTSAMGTDYVVDNVHQTALGGKVYAQAIWAELKNLPPFLSE